MDTPRTIILYHGGCPDGFGGAYAAWKKFGDAAEYIPLSRGDAPPLEECRSNEVYMIDFTYTADVMAAIIAVAARVVVLDHHLGVKEIVESMPEHVYNVDQSGATIAWNYFHPGSPIPLLLQHLEDQDLYRHQMPDTIPLHAYLEVRPLEFALWDELARMLDNPDERENFLVKARVYGEYFELLARQAVERAKLVSFEGYECYFGTSHPLKSLKSVVGHMLEQKLPPLSLTVTAHPNGYGVSIRGDGSVNVAEIASRFGGNGHHDAAGFLVPREGPFPWTPIEDETARD